MAGVLNANVDLPNTNNNVLANTPMEVLPGPGTISIWLASTQRDGICTITAPGMEGGAVAIPPIVRSTGVPQIDTDVPFVLHTDIGGKPTVQYTEVTAASAWLTAVFIPD